jgi:hypothetical protein
MCRRQEFDPWNQNLMFAARDRPECCTNGKTCPHNWYPAYLTIRSVTRLGQTDRLVIIVFPGWAPLSSNQVPENELYAKKLTNCRELAGDKNIRVFLLSSELGRLVRNVGTIDKDRS